MGVWGVSTEQYAEGISVCSHLLSPLIIRNREGMCRTLPASLYWRQGVNGREERVLPDGLAMRASDGHGRNVLCNLSLNLPLVATLVSTIALTGVRGLPSLSFSSALLLDGGPTKVSSSRYLSEWLFKQPVTIGEGHAVLEAVELPNAVETAKSSN